MPCTPASERCHGSALSSTGRQTWQRPGSIPTVSDQGTYPRQSPSMRYVHARPHSTLVSVELGCVGSGRQCTAKCSCLAHGASCVPYLVLKTTLQRIRHDKDDIPIQRVTTHARAIAPSIAEAFPACLDLVVDLRARETCAVTSPRWPRSTLIGLSTSESVCPWPSVDSLAVSIFASFAANVVRSRRLCAEFMLLKP